MALDNRIDLVNTANRRGLLLGLTLSEIMMIILFSLLLLFGAVFAEQEQDKKRLAELEIRNAELEPRARDGETALAAINPMRDILATLGIAPNQIEEILREMKLARDLREQVANLDQQASSLAPISDEQSKQAVERIRRELHQKRAELAKAEKKIEQLQKELEAMGKKQRQAAQLASAMAEAGISPEQVKDAEKSFASIKQVTEDLRQRMAKAGANPKAIEAALEQASRDWANTAMDNKTLVEGRNYWKTKYETDLGNGKKFASPCWATNGTVDPIYDVALTDDGMVMRRYQVPQWADDYDRLPTTGIKLQQGVSQQEFVSSTRPLFDYSNKKDCRFFVRLYDDTSASAKVTYQNRRRAVEGHFYIIDMKNAKYGDGN
jgi:DNA polymerase III alpha subunit (gram-positive type)